MELGQTLPIWSIIPFAGMLLSIAIFPLVRAEWWEKHQLLVALAWALLVSRAFRLPPTGSRSRPSNLPRSSSATTFPSSCSCSDSTSWPAAYTWEAPSPAPRETTSSCCSSARCLRAGSAPLVRPCCSYDLCCAPTYGASTARTSSSSSSSWSQMPAAASRLWAIRRCSSATCAACRSSGRCNISGRCCSSTPSCSSACSSSSTATSRAASRARAARSSSCCLAPMTVCPSTCRAGTTYSSSCSSSRVSSSTASSRSSRRLLTPRRG